MLQGGFQIGRISGIRISVDWSWIFIFLLVVWNLTTVFGGMHPEWGLGLQIGLALVAALLFFGSVLAHELAHAFVAQSMGLPVRSITLWLFGGVANIEREPPSARAEFLIAVVGPVTSIVLGIIFILLAGIQLPPLDAVANPLAIVDELGPVSTLLLWLGPINIILGVFNLVPGFPLDGGRILRSILWAITDNLRRATRWASYVGQAIAWLMIVAGIAMVFGVELPFFGTGVVSGLWLAFIGWFLNNAAQQSYRQVVLQDLLEDVPVERIMRRNPPVVSARAPVSTLVYENVMGTDDHAFPVMDDELLTGIVCLHDIRAVPRERWDQTLVAEIMTPRKDLATVSPQDDAAEALSKLQQQDVRQLPVVRDGILVGVLRRQDLVRWLQFQGEGERL